MSMTFVQLQDAVIADAFDETDRDQVKNWIQHNYEILWGLNEWTFRKAAANVTVTSGSSSVTNLPSDFLVALALDRADGYELEAIPEYRVFARRYLGTGNTAAGRPEAFTVLNGTLSVGPVSNETSTAYLLTYEKNPTALSADSDVPLIPSGHHMALVFGAKAEGLTLKNVLLADPLQQLFQREVQTMERNYLTDLRGARTQVRAFRPC